MDIQSLTLAYTAAAVVAVGVTAGFSASIEQTLFRLLPEEAAQHWARYVKFALAAASFAGGLPTRPTPAFVDRAAPPAPPPGLSDGLMLVMSSASGALMAASWVLLIFFAVTLLSLTAGRVYAAVLRRREAEAKAVAAREEERRKEEQARLESRPAGGEAPRKEPPRREHAKSR